MTRMILFMILLVLTAGTFPPAETSAQPFEKAAKKATRGEGWELSDIDTAKNVSYLSELEKQVILEMNKVRSNPSKYAQSYLFFQRKYYSGRKIVYPGEIPILTKEGVKAFDECYQFLLKARSVSILSPREGITKAAYDQVWDQGQTGQTGHKGSDNSDPFLRMNRYGKWDKKAAENIDYGNASAGRIVSSLLIDDGIASRGHRRNMLDPQFKYTGVAFGPHPKFRKMCVILYAAEYQEKR